MEITVTQEKGKGSVSVVHIKGELDTSNYHELVNTAQALYSAGARSLLLDLTDLKFISSAGIASLHIVTKMFRGEKADPEDVWDTFKEFDRDRERRLQKHVKLFNPSPEVDYILDILGFKQFFEIYMDLEEAIDSFSP
jgi:anti-anti-sigma factor